MPIHQQFDAADAHARRLEAVAYQLAALLRRPAVSERLRVAPGAAEWSVMEVLGHLVEMVPFWIGQSAKIVAAVEPPVFGRELDAPERLAGPAQGASGDMQALLKQFEVNVADAAEEIRCLSAADYAKSGRHIQRGAMTVAEVVGLFVVAHAESHLKQVREALAL